MTLSEPSLLRVNTNVPVVELKGITKRFGKVTANHNVSMSVGAGEIIALLC